MSIKNGIITGPGIDPWEVSKVLGIRSGHVGTVCTSKKIRPWAKYKPVNHPKIGLLTDEERAEVQYGMTNIPVFGSQIDMARFVAPADGDTPPAPLTGTASKYWDYELPPYNMPKRLTDFDGYWHQARRCIEPLEIDRIDVRYMADNDLICFDFPVATEEANLKISDFAFAYLWGKFDQLTQSEKPLYYLGVCLTDGSAEGTRTMTQSSMMNGGIQNLIEVNGKKYVRIQVTRAAFMAAAPPSGNLTVFPFVTDDSKTTFGLPGLESHPAVPFNFAASIVNVITGDRYLIAFGEIKVTPQAMNGPWKITVAVSIKNQTDSALYIDSGNRGTLKLTGPEEHSTAFMNTNTEIAPGKTVTVTREFEVRTTGSYYAILQWQVAPGSDDNYNITSPNISI